MTTVSTIVMGVAGLVCATVLGIVARAFATHEDPRVEQACELLPGINCGGCGYPGCAEYAKALIVDGAEVSLCLPGGADVVEKLSQLLGVQPASAQEKKIALVLCAGDTEKSHRKFAYNGVSDCVAAIAVGGGDTACSYGCLGYGTCARACPFGAIEINSKSLAVVHPELCTGCGICVKTCPRSLIKLVPESSTIHVLCSSHAKGGITKRACDVGCIGCGRCAKFCGTDAMALDNALAVVNYDNPPTDAKVLDECPTKSIVERYLMQRPPETDGSSPSLTPTDDTEEKHDATTPPQAETDNLVRGNES